MLRFFESFFVQPGLKPDRSTKIHHPHVTSYNSGISLRAIQSS